MGCCKPSYKGGIPCGGTYQRRFLELLSTSDVLGDSSSLPWKTKTYISTMSTTILRVTRSCLATTVNRAPFLVTGRGAIFAALRAPTPSRKASGVLTIGARPFSSKSQTNTGPKYPRLVPTVAVTTSLVIGIYLYRRGRYSVKLDQSGGKGRERADERLVGAEVRN